MTLAQRIITIALCVIATVTTRALPFLVFRDDRPTPKYIQYLGTVLPGSVFAMLVVYCMKNVSLVQYSYGIPEAAAAAVTIFLHLKKRAMLLSIAGGTLCYMILVQLVF